HRRGGGSAGTPVSVCEGPRRLGRRSGTLSRNGAGIPEGLTPAQIRRQGCLMHWLDDGIVLGVRKHGEANAILELMTRAHGRHLGLVRGGSGSRLRPVLQPGNTVHASWSARLDDHLGTFAVEGLNLRAGALLTSSHAVYAVTHLA